MENVMAEYAVRVIRQDNDAFVQLVIHGTEVVAFSISKPVGLTGNNLYLSLFKDTLNRIKAETTLNKEVKEMKPGDIVTIYQDPITQEKVDGKARLLQRIDYLDATLEQWQVKFLDDGMQTVRLIKERR